ncbi:MAG: YbaK/EbsC family protein [Gammaproteobacteria bacterium]|nr:YbaK/EbsC family protein [Gammaproteobacteria bacterium]MDJ0870998.1 YbaK/EbsC family protein [Gammaproteobacteria bacterium]
MAISKTLQDYLAGQGVHYTVHSHPRTMDSSHTAQATHVPGDRLAKAVMLEDDDGYVMAVVPSSHRVSLGQIHHQLERRLGLATEGELKILFPDCDLGAIPPLGGAWGMNTCVDAALLDQPEVWFEAGDHEAVLRVSGSQFRTLMAGATAGHFSSHT